VWAFGYINVIDQYAEALQQENTGAMYLLGWLGW